MLVHSVAYGCTEANWLVLPRYAPRGTPYFDSSFGRRSTPLLDSALAKSTQIRERVSLQLRLDAFSATNTQNSAGGGFNTNPEDPTLEPSRATAVWLRAGRFRWE
jgi:hypothetical protein